MMTGSASESASRERGLDRRVDRLALGLAVDKRDVGNAARLSQVVRDHISDGDYRGVGRDPLGAGLSRARKQLVGVRRHRAERLLEGVAQGFGEREHEWERG